MCQSRSVRQCLLIGTDFTFDQVFVSESNCVSIFVHCRFSCCYSCSNFITPPLTLTQNLFFGRLNELHVGTRRKESSRQHVTQRILRKQFTEVRTCQALVQTQPGQLRQRGKKGSALSVTKAHLGRGRKAANFAQKVRCSEHFAMHPPKGLQLATCCQEQAHREK